MIEKKSSFAAHSHTKPSNSANPNITPVRVAASRQLNFEPSIDGESEKALADGSANDGSGTTIKQGLIFGHKYDYKVTHINDSPPDNIIFNWLISYQSPDTSKNQLIEKKLHDIGDKITILIDDPDMCGCEITIRAYFNDPKAGYELKQHVHNRFRWFDGKRIEQQINERVQDNWRVDQGQSSLCGMAALYYVMLKKSPEKYMKLAKELHRTGRYIIGKYKINPSETMYEINPQQDHNFQNMNMWDVDWIVLAATRSSESNLGYNGIEKGSSDQLGGVNWPDMLTRMTKDVAGYQNVNSEGVGLLGTVFQKLFSSSSDKSTHALSELFDIDKKYQQGHQVLMMIDALLVQGVANYSVSDVFTESHWIVYEGGLEFDGVPATTAIPLETVTQVRFKIYTWGSDPSTAEFYDLSGSKRQPTGVIKTLGGITSQEFSSNYYGYIEAF